LDRQVELFGFGVGLDPPVVWTIPWPGGLLGLEGSQHIGMEMDGPVILNQVDTMCPGIAGTEHLIEANQLSHANATGLEVGHLSGKEIESSHYSGSGVAPIATSGQWSLTSGLFVSHGQGRLPVVSNLIRKEQDAVSWVFPDHCLEMADPSQFSLVSGVRAMDVIPASLPVNLQLLQCSPDTRDGMLLEPGTDSLHRGKRPAAAIYPKLMGVSSDDV